jgi:hypothetical protein
MTILKAAYFKWKKKRPVETIPETGVERDKRE